MRDTCHHVGVDEAGLGPNLGPLVIVATRWTGPACSTEALWDRFTDAVTQQADGERLHVGDSKAVYKSKADFPSLERSARGILAAAGVTTNNLNELVTALDPAADLGVAPWYAVRSEEWGVRENRGPALLRDVLEKTGGSLNIAAAFVTAARFNDVLDVSATKGEALSKLSLQTLRRVWSPDDEPTSVWCDKHGGRNRYDDLLLDHCDGAFVVRHEEGRAASRYTVGESEITFGVKSERHFPVACASLVAKYLRQRAMKAFNTWWAGHIDNLKPTEGYPQDAKRFRDDVADVRAKLDVSSRVFWRRK